VPKLVPLRPKEIEKILLKNGFVVNVSKSSHRQYFNPETKAHTTVAFHSKTIPLDTLRSIIRQSQLPDNLFRK
jgi:predicted RNA binding protein YcfA (HicA-like mRNA interferase family)